MRLLTKLTLLITSSKLILIILFVILLPTLVINIASRYTDYHLAEQKQKVLSNIGRNGIGYYLDGDSSYGSYTMLKDEYISLVLSQTPGARDTFETSQRIIEGDTINYRILVCPVEYRTKWYTLEIGKTVASIGEYNRLLQRFTLYALVGLLVLTILIDLFFTRYFISPLGTIIKTKLLRRKFPFKDELIPVKTSTSDFKYLDQSLIDLMGKIKEAFDKEREFTSNASHELMTPIGILYTNMENLLINSDMDPELQAKVTGMMKTLNRLKKIVHSLLFISRIENDQFATTQPIHVPVLFAELIEELGVRLEARDIRFSMKLNEKVSIQNVNHTLLFQLFYNLIINAIKYNEEGGGIQVYDEMGPGSRYTIYVEDTGTGIPEAELQNIFDKFKKTSRSQSQGFGLGLYIVKTISRYYGLDVQVHSELSKGTVFEIGFPENLFSIS